MSATEHALLIRLTDEAQEGTPAVSLFIGRSPNASTVCLVGITFADGDGGGGGGRRMFDLPFVERWFHRSTGRLWTFGLAPSSCEAVSIGDATGRVIKQDYLSFAAFLIDTEPDIGEAILFQLEGGEELVRPLTPLDAEDLN